MAGSRAALPASVATSRDIRCIALAAADVGASAFGVAGPSCLLKPEKLMRLFVSSPTRSCTCARKVPRSSMPWLLFVHLVWKNSSEPRLDAVSHTRIAALQTNAVSETYDLECKGELCGGNDKAKRDLAGGVAAPGHPPRSRQTPVHAAHAYRPESCPPRSGPLRAAPRSPPPQGAPLDR